MATTSKNKKKEKAAQPIDTTPISEERKRQIRLGSGIFFLLTGVFICFSIISYCFTWSTDQDHLLRAGTIWDFLLYDRSPIANWGGRLGAALSHILVFKGAGIASLVIGIGISAIGIHMVYGEKAVPLFRYMRWLSILLLLIAPIFTYLVPESTFALGGAWGKVSIGYLNGLLGLMGTGMLLLGTLLFFAFAIFALDIRPILNRMRSHAGKMANALTPAPIGSDEFPDDEQFSESMVEEPVTEAQPVSANGNQLNYGDDIITPPIAPTPKAAKQWDMTMVEKPGISENDEENPDDSIEDETEEENELTDEEKEYNEYLQQKEAEVTEQRKATNVEDLDFSVVVKQEEKPAIKHGDHISIADNEPFAPEESLHDYKYPTLDLLEERVQEAIALNKEELDRNKDQIIQTLRSFGIEIKTITATVGPTVTLYEIVPQEGVRISKIRNLEDDIALNLAALGIRIIAPIPGKGTIGIEVPNANKQIVSMKALLASDKFVNSKMSLPIALGKKIDNENYIVDLATMPHLLMAGATGQGKSVGINAILVSLLYKKHPSQLKFVMVDPKKVELSIYRKIEKHFLAKLPNETEPIITDTKKAIYTLKALCDEMDNRYELLKEAGARNIKEYNEKIVNRKIKNPAEHKYLPFIVLVIDEFADLIMTAGKEVEMPIARLAQLARAVGIHLIIATQRPSVNVITGTIKANFPARIAFKVSAKVDSRTILDAGGAEQLIGRGDMLVSHGSELLRLQCAFVDTPEVEDIVNFIGDQRGYPSAHHLPEPEMDDEDGGGKNVDLKNRDKLFEDCARLVVQMQSGSTSNLQRRLNLGYNRAGRIMDQLEAAGVVGPTNGSKPREVYYKSEAELEQYLESLG